MDGFCKGCGKLGARIDQDLCLVCADKAFRVAMRIGLMLAVGSVFIALWFAEHC